MSTEPPETPEPLGLAEPPGVPAPVEPASPAQDTEPEEDVTPAPIGVEAPAESEESYEPVSAEPDADFDPGLAYQQDRRRRREIARKARDFLVHLDTLGRLLQIHDANNAAVKEALERLSQDVSALQADGEATLVFAEGHTFVNGVWVRASQRAWEAGIQLTRRLEELRARGLTLDASITPDTLIQLSRFVGVDRDKPAGDIIGEGLAGASILPMPTEADQARAGRSAQRARAAEIFREGMLTIGREDLQKLDLYMRRRQRTLVQNLVQLSEDDPEELLALTAVRDPKLPPSAHTLTVSILAIAMGRILGLSRRELMRLGMAALGHNVGEALVDQRLFEVARPLDGEERDELERHPLLGMKHQLMHYGFNTTALDRAVVSAEHHLHWDGSGRGYPFSTHHTAHLFSRIISVADVFDALCTPRPHRDPYTPDQSVKLVRRLSGNQLDPDIVFILRRLIGRYPPGSLVELDTGEWAIVLGPGAGSRPLKRPRVVLISDEDGFTLPQPIAIDLGERHPRRKAWLRTIVRALDPRRAKVSVAQLLFADRVDNPPLKLDHDVPLKKRVSPF